MNRAYELKLMAYEPYWREFLGAWLLSILLLALIKAVLIWMRKPKPGEFARLLGLPCTLAIFILPALACFLGALRALDDHGFAAAMAVMIGGPLLAIFAAYKLQTFFIWLLTGFGQWPREARPRQPAVPPNTGPVPTIDGKPISLD